MLNGFSCTRVYCMRILAAIFIVKIHIIPARGQRNIVQSQYSLQIAPIFYSPILRPLNAYRPRFRFSILPFHTNFSAYFYHIVSNALAFQIARHAVYAIALRYCAGVKHQARISLLQAIANKFDFLITDKNAQTIQLFIGNINALLKTKAPSINKRTDSHIKRAVSSFRNLLPLDKDLPQQIIRLRGLISIDLSKRRLLIKH